jgi:hypothetical protein
MSKAKRSETALEDPDLTPQKKKLKALQRYRDAYREKWPCLMRSTKGEEYVHCNFCNLDFSCAHGGRNDCRRHVDSARHKQSQEAQKSQPVLSAFMSKKSDESQHKHSVMRAEAYLCDFLASHNLPFSAADTFTATVKKMLPDSKIASGM